MSNEDEMFCLMMKKCGCGTGGTEGGKLPDLSYEEQEAGFKDADGKTVYMKTIDLGAFPGNGSKDIPHGIDALHDILAHQFRFNDGEAFHTGNYMDGVTCMVMNTRKAFIRMSANRQDLTRYSAKVTLYYTCTDR